MLDLITPVILTRDEEVNIGRTLGQLTWARDVIVVDSLSTDSTAEVVARFPNARLFPRELDTLAGQSNFGIEQTRTPWVLLLDADYFVPDAMVDELRSLAPPPTIRAYHAAFRYAIHGKPLRASLYPARVVLFDKAYTSVWQDGHTPRIQVDGETAQLRSRVIHDDRKNFARFVQRQRRYMRQEAEKIRDSPARALPLSGRVRKMIVIAPFAVVAHSLFVKGLVLDGVPGLRYVWERFVAELMLSRELLRRR
jgi:glycosyltransferase involved in cell wall biosynthesis